MTVSRRDGGAPITPAAGEVLHPATTVIDTTRETDQGADQEAEDERPTRTELRAGRKAYQASLNALTLRLAKLSPKVLATLDLDPTIAEAVTALTKIPHGSGYARQRRLTAKLLRDYDIEAIDRQVDIVLGKRQLSARPAMLERWRVRLVEEGDAALGELLAEHPSIDRQPLRQAVRAAAAEKKKGATGRRWRALYEMLGDAIP